MNKSIAKQEGKERRHNRVRAKVAGTPARPRLAVYKSNRYMHAQIIDDTVGKTLVAGTTKTMTGVKKMLAAEQLGAALAKQAVAAGITTIVFDRGGFRYTGRIAQLADAARKGGLIF